MTIRLAWLALLGPIASFGCDSGQVDFKDGRHVGSSSRLGVTSDYAEGRSDASRARAANMRILFIGNSHTMSHDMPNLICRMVAHLKPDARIYGHSIGVAFLEDVASHPTLKPEFNERTWDYVILQGQKISTSGRFTYDRGAGIALAEQARLHGAQVYFFSEWGMQGQPENGPRHEAVYAEMASAAKVGLIRVGRAWDRALARNPDLPLFESDGNHQSKTGAFLTASTIASQLAEAPAGALSTFPWPELDEPTRASLLNAAQLPEGEAARR